MSAPNDTVETPDVVASRFSLWRRVHRLSSGTIVVLGAVHSVLTAVFYRSWNPDAVWFLGTGIALISIGVMNWAHVGLEPCSLPTAKAVRVLNWLYVPLAAGAVIAVPEPQAFILAAALLMQAIAGRVTLAA